MYQLEEKGHSCLGEQVFSAWDKVQVGSHVVWPQMVPIKWDSWPTVYKIRTKCLDSVTIVNAWWHLFRQAAPICSFVDSVGDWQKYLNNLHAVTLLQSPDLKKEKNLET